MNTSTAVILPGQDGTLPADVAERFLASASLRDYRKGQALFAQGSRPALMFGVRRGHVRVSVGDSGPDARMAAVLGPGQWFGETPLLDAQARAFNAVAQDRCRIAVITATAFQRLVAEPQVLMAVTRLVCARYRQVLGWVEEQALLPLPARLARMILAGGDDGLRLSQQTLASRLGVSRPTVNRQLARWAAAGWIHVGYGAVVVLDSEAMQGAACV